METLSLEQRISAMPKAELHLHLEGSIDPATAVELAARHGHQTSVEDVAARYAPGDFLHFIDAFKWVTSFLRKPADYALIARRLAESLRAQNVVYAEITLSVGVMLFRKQDPVANFAALRDAAAEVPGIRCAWIFDAVRQWGSNAAMEVARIAARLHTPEIVAFGIGGDELAVPTSDFRGVYYYAATQGLHRLIHAGEIGGPENVFDAVEILGAERIGHGIAVMRDSRIMDFLAARGIPLEVCPTSNLRTGALSRQLGHAANGYADHPLAAFMKRGIPVTLSTDDPAMFEVSLSQEYMRTLQMELSPADLVRLAEASFQHAFISSEERAGFLHEFRSGATSLGLL